MRSQRGSEGAEGDVGSAVGWLWFVWRDDGGDPPVQVAGAEVLCTARRLDRVGVVVVAESPDLERPWGCTAVPMEMDEGETISVDDGQVVTAGRLLGSTCVGRHHVRRWQMMTLS